MDFNKHRVSKKENVKFETFFREGTDKYAANESLYLL